MQSCQSYIYLLTNKYNTVLYTGVTSDLKKRVWQYKERLVEGYTNMYMSLDCSAQNQVTAR